MESNDLANKRVVVTGGGSGIGEACCRMFAAAGAYVVVADNNVAAGTAVAKALSPTDGAEKRVRFIQVDVSSWTSQTHLFDQALDFFPDKELDILVTSAGVNGHPTWRPRTPSSQPPPVDSAAKLAQPGTRCLDIGLVGSMYSAHIAAQYAMGLHANAPSGSKAIVLVGSTVGYRLIPGGIDYTVLKWGIRGLFKSLRHELVPMGVRVNLIAPTFVDTPMVAPRMAGLRKSGVKLARKEDVTSAVRRLAGDRSLVGRAMCISGNGVEDLEDDHEGLDGFRKHAKLIDDGVLPPLSRVTLPRL